MLPASCSKTDIVHAPGKRRLVVMLLLYRTFTHLVTFPSTSPHAVASNRPAPVKAVSAATVNGTSKHRKPQPSVFAGGGDSDDEDQDFEAKCLVYMR